MNTVVEPKTLTAPAPVAMPWTSQFELASKITGRAYRISVFAPPVPPPEAGYPVLVALDAAMTFPIAAAMAGTYAFSGASAIVVGVGYAAPLLDMQVLRFRDFTPPTPIENVPVRPGMPTLTAEQIGGSDLFRRFLIEELRPVIAAQHKVDPAREALFGYSLGGLFVLDALFKAPVAWRSYIAASPSIWWNERAVLEDEGAFRCTVKNGRAAPRVLITVGAREQTLPHRLPPGMTPDQVEALMDEARMVDNAWELGERLGKVAGGPGYAAVFHAFDEEDHLTALAASVGRALDFATRE
jgi:predicted alpha/beta superfamily hydrolase